jgi:ubiquinol-cytochrome c reductase cytochrome b subunit
MAASSHDAAGKGGFRAWLNKRLPVDEFVESQLTGYFAPENFNIWYFFGVVAAGARDPDCSRASSSRCTTSSARPTAFDSVEYIMRDVEWRLAHPLPALDRRLGLLHRRLPAHVPRADVRLVPAPRELLWIFGMFIYLALMAEAFIGYLLPWGNMSYWGAQVIVNLFGTIPVIGAGPRRMDPRRLRHRRHRR